MADSRVGRASAGLRKIRVAKLPGSTPEDDWVAVEEPLEIRLHGESFVVTMRTPGNDRELAAGFLFTEGIVRHCDEIEAITPCQDPLAYDPDNLIDVQLSPAARARHAELDDARRVATATAACGLCGKARIEAVYQRLPTLEPLSCDEELLQSLPDRMSEAQELFHHSGGLHAAALFEPNGELIALREDVGRHNAVDKLVGRALLADELPWHGRIVVTSGRAGFEVVQKSMMAAAPVLVAVGAASSLSVEVARRGGLGLYSFVRRGRGNRHL